MRLSCKSPLILFLSTLAFGQVPTGLTGTMDNRNAPELSFLLFWQPVPGATAYNVYDAPNPKLESVDCPATLPFDQQVTTTSYADDPNPGWYLKTVHQSGARTWCYAVSSIVNGVESAKSAPVSLSLGNEGYVFFNLRAPGTFDPADICAGGKIIPPPSLNIADYDIQFYYQASSTDVPHYFHTLNFFEGPGPALAIVWQAPNIATDGTVIPWSNTGSYLVRIGNAPGKNILKKSVVAGWSPRFNRVGNYYTQFNIAELSDPGKPDDGAQCAFSAFGTDFWQNVTE